LHLLVIETYGKYGQKKKREKIEIKDNRYLNSNEEDRTLEPIKNIMLRVKDVHG
jgi:hypothetical protein